MTTLLAGTSEAIDRRTQVITALEPAHHDGSGADLSEYGNLEPSITQAIAAGKRCVVVDVSPVDGLDTDVLRVLLRGDRRLGWRNGRLAVVCKHAALATMELVGLDAFVSVDDALSGAGARA